MWLRHLYHDATAAAELERTYAMAPGHADIHPFGEGAGMSVFTDAELACLRTKLLLARIATVTLSRPRFVIPVKGDVIMTSILVTGGTGTLGRPVAQRLRHAGASVTVLSRPPGNRRRHPLHRR
jgi:hypothetical protein